MTELLLRELQTPTVRLSLHLDKTELGMLTTTIVITVIMILLSGFFSGSEIAYIQSSKVRMAIDATRSGLADKIIRKFSMKEDMFISTMLIGNNVVLVIYGITISVIINPILERWFNNNEALVLVCNTLFSTLIILLAGEFLPKAAFRINPNKTIRMLSLPLYIMYLLLYPVAWTVSHVSNGMKRAFGIKDAENESDNTSLTMEELDDYIEETIEQVGSEEKVENEVKIFRNAIDFKDTQIGECMRPRNEIVAVALDGVSREELLKQFISTGLSKIVVYREDIDDIAGYIHISELFNTGSDWRKCLKPVLYTPETMLANKMMRRMISEKRSMVIVVDEYGGTAGLATLEDLVEEIFGEIEDEHDRDVTWGHKLPDGTYELSGRAEIEAINEQFGLGLKESDDYHTIAGFLLEHLGKMPSEGEDYLIEGYTFKVTKMDSMKILQIKVAKTE